MIDRMRKGSGRWHLCVLAALLLTLTGCSPGQTSAPAVTSPTPSQPECSTATAPVGTLRQPLATVGVSGSPFAAVPIPGTDNVVVSTTPTGGGSAGGELDVLQLAPNTRRVVSHATLGRRESALGMSVSHDGRWLAVTTTNLTEIVSVSKLLAADADPVVSSLNDTGTGTIEAIFSMDDHFVFIADENTGDMSVFDVAAARTDGFASQPVAVGQVPLGPAPVGIALSPDGRWLYATTEGNRTTPGALWAIDEQAATLHPRTAVVAHINLTCAPLRVALSPAGDMAWVTERFSNLLIGVDTAALKSMQPKPIRASVQVGSEPTGLGIFAAGRYAVIVNSARFTAPMRPQSLTVVDLDAALSGTPAIREWIAAGAFPREVAIEGNIGLVTNFNSNSVELFQLPP